MGQPYFSPRLFQFLGQLRRNNRRAWFLKHRPEFEEFARQPSLRFITDLQLRLRDVSTWLVADPKPNGGSLFGQRSQPGYAGALGVAVDFARSRSNVPVWLVGNSQGSIAAVNGARASAARSLGWC